MSNLCPKKAKISPHKVAKYFGRYYGGGGGTKSVDSDFRAF